MFNGLKGIFTPWYILLGVGGAFCIVYAFRAMAGELTQYQCSIGFWIGFLALFIAHGYRSAYKVMKHGQKMWQDLADLSIKTLEENKKNVRSNRREGESPNSPR